MVTRAKGSVAPNASEVPYDNAASGLTATDVKTAIDQVATATGVTPGMVSVKANGAVGDGVTDDTAAFQATIDALPADGGFAYLEEGDYIVTTSSLDVGTKTVIWWGNGVVNSSVNFNSLPGITLGINRNSSVSDPTGQIVLYRDDPNENYGTFTRIRSLADYSSAVSGIVSTSLEVERVVGAGPGNSNWGALFDVTTDQSQDNSRALASYHKIIKGSGSRAKIWGLAISAINESTVDTMVVGAEINARAIGSMGANTNRLGAQFIVSTVEDEAKADFEAIIACAVNGTAGGGIEGTTGDLTADSKFGIKVTEESPGQITNSGVFVDTTGIYGVRVDGSQTTSAVRVNSASPYGVDLANGTYSIAAMRVGDGDPIAFNESSTIDLRADGTNVILRNKGASPTARYEFDMDRSAPTAPVMNSYNGLVGYSESVSTTDNPVSFNAAQISETPSVSCTFASNSTITIGAAVARAKVTWCFLESSSVATTVSHKIVLNSASASWKALGAPVQKTVVDAGGECSGQLSTVVINTSGASQTLNCTHSALATTTMELTGSNNANVVLIEVLEWA